MGELLKHITYVFEPPESWQLLHIFQFQAGFSHLLDSLKV